MREEKGPVCACIDQPLTAARTDMYGSPTISAHRLATQQGTEAEPQTHGSAPIRIAAVPLMHGSELVGALWLEQQPLQPSPASTTSQQQQQHQQHACDGVPLDKPFGGSGWPVRAVGASIGGPAGVLSNAAALRALGFACSMCLLSAEGGGGGVRWRAGARAALGGAASLAALVAQLTEAVAEHVRRRFVLEAAVRTALAPPGPDQQLALLLVPAPQSSVPQLPLHSATDGGPASAAASPAPASMAAAVAAVAAPRSSHRLSVTAPIPLPVPTPGVRASSGQVAQLYESGGAARAQSRLRLRVGAEAASPTARAPAVAASPTAAHWANGVAAGIVRDATVDPNVSPFLGMGRFSIEPPALAPSPPPAALSRLCPSFSAAATAAPGNGNGGGGFAAALSIAPLDVLRTPSIRARPASSRSIVIQLTAADAAAVAHGGVAAAADGGGSAVLPAVHAQAFPLQHTLLGSALLALQRRMQLPVPLGSLPGGGAAAVASTGKPSLPWVVEDTALHVQDVHKPSGDVCVLMGLRRTARGLVSGIVPWPGAAGAGGAGGDDAGGGPGSGGAGSNPGGGGAPRSLVLLALPLGDEALLALYLCFPRRLPGGLLEAVRASGQELLEQTLGPLLRAKLRDPAIAPEYDTLCNASPGSYAVVQSLPPSQMPMQSLSVARMSTGGIAHCTFNGSELDAVLGGGAITGLPGGGGGGTAAGGGESAALPRSPGLLSGILSTADMESLLAQQAAAQQGAAAQGGAGSPGSVVARSLVPPVIRRGVPPASASAEFVVPGRSVGGGAPARGVSGGSRAASGANPSWRAAVAAATSVLQLPGSQSNSDIRRGGGGAGGGAVTTGAASLEPFTLGLMLQSDAHTDTPPSAAAAVSPLPALPLLLTPSLHLPLPARGGSTCSLADLEAGGFTASSLITVAGVDAAAVARQQLELLMGSVSATIADPGVGGPASAAPMEDLDSLELGVELGRGGGGTVFRGRMGTLDVAVKLMTLPAADATVDAAAALASPAAGPAMTAAAAAAAATAAAAAAAAEKQSLNARREMLRNATELAVQCRVSHPNVVQMYGVYPNVVMVPERLAADGSPITFRLRPAAATAAGGGGAASGPDSAAAAAAVAAFGPAVAAAVAGGGSALPQQVAPPAPQQACVAAVFELCDGGSLGSALAARTFPGSDPRDRNAPDMRPVYLTLLDVALALRHLHASGLVHRDVKPANLLLRSAPRDPRGFTAKLADFGFVLRLAEAEPDGTRVATADQACGTVTHMAPEALVARAKVSAAVDVYAFGILMWEMFSAGVRPYPHIKPDKIPGAVYRGARPAFGEGVPIAYRSLAAACWSTDPRRRPKASELVNLINDRLQELEAAGAGGAA